MKINKNSLANLKHFNKGDDPRRNSTGLNRGSKWLTRRLEEALRETAKGSKEPQYELLIKRVLSNAIVKGDQRAAEHIWNRLEGAPKETKEVEVKEKSEILSDEQIKRFARYILSTDTRSEKQDHTVSDSD